MFRTPWELDVHVRHQIERIGRDRREWAGAPKLAGNGGGPSRLERSVGLGLIRVGRRLAGDAAPNLGAPTTTTFGRRVAWPPPVASFGRDRASGTP